MENKSRANYKSFNAPEIYKKKFESLYSKIEQCLVDMKKTYFSYKLNNDLSYPKYYNNLIKLSADLYELESDLNKDSEDLKKNVDVINFFTKEIENKNLKLKNKIKNLKDNKLASQGELNIQKTYFNEQLIQNLILGILILLYLGLFIKVAIKK